MSSTRIIKKYPNRRLYDTELSRYITLSDIRELVMKGTDFQVVDTNTNEDLTRSILLQIMLDEESGGEPLFSAKMLSQIIRFYGGTVQGILARYLEESLSMFVQQQDQLNNTVGTDPVKAITNMAEQNMRMWADMQKNFFKAAGLAGAGNRKKEE
ncbi:MULTISPECIES: polyhydroxyalkanoate synthesis repressor PhaR [Sedimenticola]|uniref:Polyhydroxyalkanoate synthesis repressor PhaR n=1 Tax=Sedimenticola selenatireducens TaxID=191960 RepID=A0A2N6CZB8_9GAMM|nr:MULTISPECIES: polyhydroxyalkanoate synthesis repressor PhaR [Sedimenticola]MCW8904969.1 polyhydroxyalkanoate synthesis repressor PhaR [Sedimenticola sp.]PLX62740.1 MAG: polyhydroxyalkanoate synthesis repressor PhaR [Sedimenticola selenatireducens]